MSTMSTDQDYIRRVVVTTSRIDPPIHNRTFQADGLREHQGDPISGIGMTEADAVRDLFENIAWHEDNRRQYKAGRLG